LHDARPICHKHDVNAVAFSPDGTMFLTGGWDGTVRLWNTATGEEIRVFAHESTGMESGILLKRNSMASPTVRSTEYALPGTKHRSEEHTSELQSRENLVCRLLLEKKNIHMPSSNVST